jgi:hypothetical protein
MMRHDWARYEPLFSTYGVLIARPSARVGADSLPIRDRERVRGQPRSGGPGADLAVTVQRRQVGRGAAGIPALGIGGPRRAAVLQRTAEHRVDGAVRRRPTSSRLTIASRPGRPWLLSTATHVRNISAEPSARACSASLTPSAASSRSKGSAGPGGGGACILGRDGPGGGVPGPPALDWAMRRRWRSLSFFSRRCRAALPMAGGTFRESGLADTLPPGTDNSAEARRPWKAVDRPARQRAVTYVICAGSQPAARMVA